MSDIDELIKNIARLLYYLGIIIRTVTEIQTGNVISIGDIIKELEENIERI